MWGLVNTIPWAPRRCIILYRLDPALVEFTDPLKPCWVPMSQTQGATLMATVSSWCPCVQCSVTSQQWWQRGQLTGALLQNRLFLHSALLYLQLKLTGTNQNTGWMFKLHLSPFLSDHFPPVFCIGFGGMSDCLLIGLSFQLNTRWYVASCP